MHNCFSRIFYTLNFILIKEVVLMRIIKQNFIKKSIPVMLIYQERRAAQIQIQNVL
jgi:hypothetical protein